MIPKKIHYCWFGRGEKPKLAKKCIASWKKYMSDYEIIEWNEDNFDVGLNEYTKYCYSNKKWAFLSDFVRLYVVEKYGGIYLDTDVELLCSLNSLSNYEAFFGFENDNYVATGLGFGAEKNHQTVIAMLEEYYELRKNGDGTIELTGCPKLNTKALEKLGLKLNGKRQCVKGAQILPQDFLNPYDDAVGVLKKTENTYSIHWYSKSALSLKSKIRSKITRPFHRLFGVDCFKKLK